METGSRPPYSQKVADQDIEKRGLVPPSMPKVPPAQMPEKTPPAEQNPKK